MKTLNEIQQEILINANIPKNEINDWIYNNQSIVFDFLVHDFFIGLSYNISYKKITFFLRNESKSNYPSRKIYKQYFEFIKTCYPQFNISVSENNFSFSCDSNYQPILTEILNKTYNYLKQTQSIEPIINIDLLDDSLLDKLLNSNKHIGIKANGFFLSYARDNNLNNVVYKLCNNGFIATEYLLGTTVFKKIELEKYDELLPYFPETFDCLNNVIFNLEKPKLNTTLEKNLLIIFSYTNKSNEKPLERYYTHSYPFISNTLLPNTYIVRIADLGGAFGCHGLNTKFDTNVEKDIQKFIKSLASLYEINEDKIVILGASSGGTGALYHALLGNYKTYSIDPYLGSEEYYKGKDPLYLKVLAKDIKESFLTIQKTGKNDAVICTSKNSEFYSDIINLKARIPELKIIEYNDPGIKNHPQVASKTNYLAGVIINNLLLDYKIKDTILDF